MALQPSTNPPGSLQEDLRYLERWLWIGGMLAFLLLVATIVMGLSYLERRDWSTESGGIVPEYNNLIAWLQFVAPGGAFAVEGALLLSAGQRLTHARHSGGSVAGAFRLLRWAILLGPSAALVVAVLVFLPMLLI